jgi:hypothetical protein
MASALDTQGSISLEVLKSSQNFHKIFHNSQFVKLIEIKKKKKKKKRRGANAVPFQTNNKRHTYIIHGEY